MGSPEFSVPTLNTLVEQYPNSQISVITQTDKAKGRQGTPQPTAIKICAQSYGLCVYTPHNKTELEVITHELNPCLVIVIAFGMILPKSITDTYFCINTHASILPQYRGASPIQSALLNGDKETGITLIKMDEGMDTGPILTTTKVPILNTDNLGTLTQQLSETGATTLLHFLNNEYISQKFTLTEQDQAQANYCHKLHSKDMRLHLDDSPQKWIQKIKAFSPKPGAYIIHDNKRIKILHAELENGYVQIQTVQPEGKKTMSYNSYCLGNPKGIPTPC